MTEIRWSHNYHGDKPVHVWRHEFLLSGDAAPGLPEIQGWLTDQVGPAEDKRWQAMLWWSAPTTRITLFLEDDRHAVLVKLRWCTGEPL